MGCQRTIGEYDVFIMSDYFNPKYAPKYLYQNLSIQQHYNNHYIDQSTLYHITFS